MTERPIKRRKTTQPSLDDLLTLASNRSSEQEFRRIASFLVQSAVINLNSSTGLLERYQLREIEFYLHSPDHPDPYCHARPEQTRRGHWYFHRSGSGESNTAAGGYRGGTRKGLDITFGDQSAARGGILIRTVRRLSDQTVINGPSKIVDEILSQYGVGKVRELVEDRWDHNTTAEQTSREEAMSLTLTESFPALEIFDSPRIGLDLASFKDRNATKDHVRFLYLAKSYRFFVEPKILTSNGKANTFVSLYKKAQSSESRDRRLEYVGQTMNMRPKTVAEYASIFDSAQANPDRSRFIGKKTIGDTKGVIQLLATFIPR